MVKKRGYPLKFTHDPAPVHDDTLLLEWMISHCDPPNENGCREWTRLRNYGYGIFSWTGHKGRIARVTREMWRILHGPFPKHIHILHKCDNPPCCNPDHLFAGTNKDNVDDCKRKGRWLIGSRHHQSKLTEEMATEIRAMFRAGIGIHAIREHLGNGIHYTTVFDVVHRRTWKHLP